MQLKISKFSVFISKNVTIAIVILLILFLIELKFNIVEIAIGSIIEITNPFRPQTGPVWELAKQDESANMRLAGIMKTLPTDSIPPTVNSPYDLRTVLDEQSEVILSADQFLTIYNSMPPQSAQEIISPLDLLKLFYSNQWVWTKVSKEESSLRFIFQQGNYQPLLDSYPAFSVLYQSDMSRSVQKTLSEIPYFSDRILTPEQFFSAFNSLPDARKLQIINNPFLLLRWNRKISAVAISKNVENFTVLIGFEIADNFERKIFTFEASELAIGYLITQINLLFPELNLSMPGS